MYVHIEQAEAPRWGKSSASTDSDRGEIPHIMKIYK